MPMDTLNTLLQTHPRSSTMCNGCMSGRIWNSTPCWSLNGKQLPHRWASLGTTTRQTWWHIDVSCSCRSMITIWHTTHTWCLNDFYDCVCGELCAWDHYVVYVYNYVLETNLWMWTTKYLCYLVHMWTMCHLFICCLITNGTSWMSFFLFRGHSCCCCVIYMS
jgi:hypothetical protein